VVVTRSDVPNYRHAFVDNDFEPGEIFCSRLLTSGDFSNRALRAALGGGYTGEDKEGIAREATHQMLDGRLDAETIIRETCRDPRGWLAVRIGTAPSHRTTLRSCTELLTEFGPGGWYGPVHDGSNRYFVATRQALDFRLDAQTQKLRRYKV